MINRFFVIINAMLLSFSTILLDLVVTQFLTHLFDKIFEKIQK